MRIFQSLSLTTPRYGQNTKIKSFFCGFIRFGGFYIKSKQKQKVVVFWPKVVVRPYFMWYVPPPPGFVMRTTQNYHFWRCPLLLIIGLVLTIRARGKGFPQYFQRHLNWEYRKREIHRRLHTKSGFKFFVFKKKEYWNWEDWRSTLPRI